MKYALLTLAFITVALWSYNAGTMYNALDPVKPGPKCDEIARNPNNGYLVCSIVLDTEDDTAPYPHTTIIQPHTNAMTGHDLQPALTMSELYGKTLK